MGFAVLVIIMIALCLYSLVAPNESGGNSDQAYGVQKSHADRRPSPARQKSLSRFHESDSFFDGSGDEHEVDDDGYCEECDDYHD